MTIENLDRMFQPRSVAVIGASEKAGSIGRALVRNLLAGGFRGDIFPVHPHHKNILDLCAYERIEEVPAPVDLAIIATPIRHVPDIVEQCGRAGAGGAVVISAGGKEVGVAGAAVEKRIAEAAAPHKLRIIGPNCLGFANTRFGLNASFASGMPLAGKMAFISQSGAICTSVLDFSVKEHIGFSYFVSLGSMLDVDFGDMIDYVGSDPAVSSIVLYVENVTNVRNFMSAARSVSRVKPILALKAGRSAAGAKAAASHTGALASEDSVYDAAFKRAGIVRVKTFQELFDCSEFLANHPLPEKSGLGIVTNAGGPGVMAVDALSDFDVEPAKLEAATIARLDALLPPHWSRANPVDILGDASPRRYRETVEVLLQARELSGLLIMLAPQALADPAAVAEELIAGIRKQRRIPVFTAWMGGADVERGRKLFRQAGVSTFETPERAVRAFIDLYRYGRNMEILQEIPAKLPGRLVYDKAAAGTILDNALKAGFRVLTEVASKDLLQAYGVAVNPAEIARDASEAAAIAERIGYPVAVKVCSAEISHKSDAGGVVLGVGDAGAVREAFSRIMENVRDYQSGQDVEGVSIQPMLERPDYEMIVGMKKDRDFGPVLLFGTGGVFTEIIRDRALALPPLNRMLARRMIEETRLYQVLQGYRCYPAVDLTQIEEILIRLSQLVTDFSEIAAIDINPLVFSRQTAIAADARILIEPAAVAAPGHLVISPYPNQYESRLELAGVGPLLIRPIRPEDAPLLEELFATLSSQSIYYRFFTPMKALPRKMLARFTQIDYDREIALVAIREAEGAEQMLGVARVILEKNLKNAEFSVMVGDRWHGKGIGAALMQRCLKFSQQLGVTRVWGLVLAENTHMIALGKKLGFSLKKDIATNEYELCLNCSCGEGPQQSGIMAPAGGSRQA